MTSELSSGFALKTFPKRFKKCSNTKRKFFFAILGSWLKFLNAKTTLGDVEYRLFSMPAQCSDNDHIKHLFNDVHSRLNQDTDTIVTTKKILLSFVLW